MYLNTKPYRHTHQTALVLATSQWLSNADRKWNGNDRSPRPDLTDQVITYMVWQMVSLTEGHPRFSFVTDRKDLMETLISLTLSDLEVAVSANPDEDEEYIPYEFTPEEVDTVDFIMTHLAQDLFLALDEECFTVGMELSFVRRAGADLVLSYSHPHRPATTASAQQRALIYRAWNANGYHPGLKEEEETHVRHWA